MSMNQAKLNMVINLINVGKHLEALNIIIDVAESTPEHLDPITIAVMPLYKSIVRNLTKKIAMEEAKWVS